MIVTSLAIYVVTYIVSLLFFPHIYRFIVSSVGATISDVYAFGIGDIIGFYFTAPAVVAILIAFPVISILFYQWVKDALFPQEKSFIVKYAQISALFFLFGVVLSFFLVPRLVDLSAYFGRLLGVTIIYSAREIFNIWLALAVVLGIVFQFPILISLLIRAGIVSKEALRAARLYLYPLFYLVSAVITPGDLLVTDLLLLLIFVVLYEGSIVFSKPRTHAKQRSRR